MDSMESMTSPQKVKKPGENNEEKHQIKASGAEGQPCKFCGKPGGSVRLSEGRIYYAHDECLAMRLGEGNRFSTTEASKENREE